MLHLQEKSKEYLATFTLRKTRFVVSLPMKERLKESMHKAMKSQ